MFFNVICAFMAYLEDLVILEVQVLLVVLFHPFLQVYQGLLEYG